MAGLRMVLVTLVFASVAGVQDMRVLAKVPNASLQRVITMLDNLLKEMEAEQQQDDKMHEQYQAWCRTQQAATSSSIESLQGEIEELTAQLAKLYSQKSELETVIAH